MSYFNYDGARTKQQDAYRKAMEKFTLDMQTHKAAKSVGFESVTPVKPQSPSKSTSKSTSKSPSKSKRSYKHKRVKTFSSYIYDVLKQLDENATIGKKSMDVMNSLVKDTFDRLMTEVLAVLKASKKKRITARETQSAVRLLLPGDLAKHAVSEGTRAVTKFSSVPEDKDVKDAKDAKDARNKKSREKKKKPEPIRKTYSKSIMSGLKFSVGRILSNLKNTKQHASGVGVSAGIYLSAVLEYIVAETLELAINAAKDRNNIPREKSDGKKKPSNGFRINTRDLFLAIRGDKELDELFKDTTIPSAGVVANIHKELLQKSSAEEKPPKKSKQMKPIKTGVVFKGKKTFFDEKGEPIVEKVMDSVSAESLQNPAQNAQIVSALEVAAESASSRQAAAIAAAISSIEQVNGSSSDKQAERVADAVVDVLATVVSPPKAKAKAKAKTPGNRLLKEIEASKGLVQTPGNRRR